jgi:hypothetical protein
MAKLKNAIKGAEKKTMSRGGAAPSSKKLHTDKEPVGTINKKHFGHVLKTASALHGGDPYKAAHKM